MAMVDELLRRHQLRDTAPRVAALAVLDERSHLTTDEVAMAVQERIGALSTEEGYHVLDSLVTVGLVRRIEPAGSPAQWWSASTVIPTKGRVSTYRPRTASRSTRPKSWFGATAPPV